MSGGTRSQAAAAPAEATSDAAQTMANADAIAAAVRIIVVMTGVDRGDALMCWIMEGLPW